ncbi:peptide ligase PGM1-related protein [Oscillatoria salina]|uniref:peptide ligase PGM1-related protein n=1 Tax=Oscillatoria salina TaxID=331517 RepID=UPI0013B9D600|nr:peptide ligase PGM1-related protein [Oscillatoria salina]MBZ8182033.1 carboxylate-amine ligase [Oscillatoria salina IIICB1]NET89055.1 carboxylate-amine ligase [Kamptonema sp. SIO1D9]
MQSLNCQSSPEQTAKFRDLQNKLRDRWHSVDLFDQDDYDIVVIPSFSLDQRELGKIEGFLHYEERLLFSLIRLRNPHTRLIYVTGVPLSPIIIDYYLQLLPGIPFSHARSRLLLLSTYDASLKPLSQKILERPRLVERIRKAIRPGKSYMVCFNSTWFEQELSLKLRIPLLASSPELKYWGSKCGSREIFANCNIPHPDGSQNLENEAELLTATADLWARQPHLTRMVVKLNEGFSGEGNAILDLRPIQKYAPNLVDREATIAAIKSRLENLSFQAKNETWANFSARIPELGAIVEAFIEGEEKRSPSVQGYISPRGEVEILSTHDQILGGPDGQIYLGCRFPANSEYRLKLQELGIKVGQALAAKGAMERYSVDFLAVRQLNTQKWDIQAIEINLRKGGTTHPFMTLKLLTNGDYQLETGSFYSQHGQEKYYIATDNLQKEHYRGLLPTDLMDLIAYHRLHFDTSTKTGTIFHLMGALSEFGKLGLTSIGNSFAEADAIYQRVKKVLDRETEKDNRPSCLTVSPSLPITWSGEE